MIITLLQRSGRHTVPNRPASPRELIGVGSAIAGLIAGGMLLGWFVDSKADTLPVFVLIGLAVGMITACYYAYVKFRNFMKD
ncbi:AtpZ/AtpI family protein [Actinophytocola sp.]|uniref:AtpZ/AtpI family protein n=1 Tax=Actinophytocola sp. TaxID=1872138 RepID=UPI002D805CCA|nr:AtpZ/AtpI family protein [Actinophytocola sp.]HET9141175.1 AtpZ/AtpI family protein [Actinophytocola sp.]HEU5108985.1 AtpZ/AtpI family protein [Micromonosporaceae bacterium]